MEFWPLIAIWILSAIVGAFAGWQRRAGVEGFLLGLLLGVFGLFAVCFLDLRHRCPRCWGRLDGERLRGPAVCRHCGAGLNWDGKHPQVTGATPLGVTETPHARAAR